MQEANIGQDGRPGHAPSRSSPGTNVGDTERAVSAILGGTLVVLGLARRSVGGAVAALAGGELIYRGVSGRCPVYQALEINSARGDARNGAQAQVADRAHEPEVKRSITIERPTDELHARWRDPETMQQVMGFFADVRAGEDGSLHWRAQGPLNRTLAWTTRIVEEKPGELLRWEIVPGGQVSGGGSVRFRKAPGDRGTEMQLRVHFHPPGGKLGELATRFMGGLLADTIAVKALHFFKSLVLTGEIPTTDRQPAARPDPR